MKLIVVYCIRLYQFVFAPMLSSFLGVRHVCRFSPTCSEYATSAISQYGLTSGVVLSLKRIGHCRPGATGGYDPVPVRS